MTLWARETISVTEIITGKKNLHLGPNDDSEEGEDDADVQPEVYVEDNH